MITKYICYRNKLYFVNLTKIKIRQISYSILKTVSQLYNETSKENRATSSGKLKFAG